jgi:hypothetical protein
MGLWGCGSAEVRDLILTKRRTGRISSGFPIADGWRVARVIALGSGFVVELKDREFASFGSFGDWRGFEYAYGAREMGRMDGSQKRVRRSGRSMVEMWR